MKSKGVVWENPVKLIFTLLILMASSVAFAGEAGLPDPSSSPPESASKARSANDTLNVLAKRLTLTEEQKAKILPIIVERRRKIQEVWDASEQFVRQKQVQVRGINIESDKRINALLTGDQQKAYAAFEQERRLKRRSRQARSDSSS
jgi:periplasmic protein CpxP/Spy